MLAQTSPPGSPSLEPERSALEEDANPQTSIVGSTASTSPSHMNALANYEAFSTSEPSHVPAHAQSHHHYADGAGEAEAVVEEGNTGHDILDVDEGGAPLHDTDMEEGTGETPVSPLPIALPESGIAVAPTNHTTPLPWIPTTVVQFAAFDPFTNAGITNSVDHPLSDTLEQFNEIMAATEGELPPITLEQQQVLNQIMEIDDEQDFHPHFFTNPNPGILTPENHNSVGFLRYWRLLKGRGELKDIRETPRNESSAVNVRRPRVTYEELKGDEYDLQGINWQPIGVTRSSARKCRIRTFRNYTNRPHSDIWSTSTPDRLLARHQSYFRFRSMDLRPDVRLLHFQLRNILGCASRTRVFYPSTDSTVRELDPTTGQVKTAMDFVNDEESAVSTLAAEEGILMTGSFYGTYRYRHIEAEDTLSCSDGRLTDHPSGITNHVQISSSRRSSVPLAAFASNDYGFRIVDLATNQTISDRMYDYALNCTTLSPCRRLRVMVGDLQNVLIADAETGEILQSLEGHRDFGFACDWASDGYTIATGNQDKSIRIWDARKWKNSKGESISVSVMRTEMAGVRSLRFSPLGSGKRLLLAAEEADIVNIIDAQTFKSKQTVDIFGELAGVSFASAGQEVIALSSDPVRGGVLRLERCDHGAEDTFNYSLRRYSRNWWRTSDYDWLPTPQQVVDHPNSQATLTQKRRQAAMAEDWFF